MNDLEKNKGAGLKYLLFIGIPVIIVLGVLGAYYQMTNPMTILTKTINTAYNQIDSLLIEVPKDFNINNNPASIKGNLSFTTDLELNGLEDFQKYNYDFNMDLDLKNEFVAAGLKMKDNEKTIISGNYYQIGKNSFLESKELFNQLLKLEDQNLEFNELFNFSDLNNENLIQIEDSKYLLKKVKESFENTLNKKYLTREKTDITIDGRQIKTTKISYLFDQENQERTYKKIANDLSSDSKSLEILAKLTNSTIEEIESDLKEDISYTDDYSIVLYTEGWNQNIVRISLLQNNIDQLTYINFKDNQSIQFQNDILITIKSLNKSLIEFDYSEKSSNISGTIKVSTKENNENETNNTIYFKLNSSDFDLEINLDLMATLNKTIEKPDTSNAKDITSLTPSEIGTIFENLENALKDTFLIDLIEQNIM
ncbi:MAG: hypothetical protein HFI09_03090 [Bacilli bacterium]|nr:hypothetical protein [Bacilli bacterium]